MILEPKSEIVIGSFKFRGVTDVEIRNSIHSYINTAKIIIPATCTIKKKGQGATGKLLNTGEQFKDGDAVTISLYVNGKGGQEFKGFVSRRGEDVPLVIECEGYSYLMRRANNVNKLWKQAKVSTILKDAMGSLPITVKVDSVADIELTNIQAKNASAAEVLDLVIKECKGALNAFFIEPDVLWVGMAYLPQGDGVKDSFSSPEVKYRIGYNVQRDNSLKQREPYNIEVVVLTKKTKRERGAPSPDLTANVIKWTSNHLGADGLDKLKQALVRKKSYTGYEGSIHAFFIPLCYPGYKAFVSNPVYKDRDGVYLVEGIVVRFGDRGYWRSVEIGPKIQTA